MFSLAYIRFLIFTVNTYLFYFPFPRKLRTPPPPQLIRYPENFQPTILFRPPIYLSLRSSVYTFFLLFFLYTLYFRWQSITKGVKEIKVNAFKCVNFVSFGGLKNSSDTSTKTGSALVASTCCMLAKSIFYILQTRRSEKQYTNVYLKLKWLKFTTADFVILNAVKKMKNRFAKKNTILLHWQNFADANQQFSNLPLHFHPHLPYADANCKGWI